MASRRSGQGSNRKEEHCQFSLRLFRFISHPFAFIQYAIHQFIRSIASALSDTAIVERAITLFSQAMATGNYHWGRKAKLTAAAAIAIARRESHKPDSLRTIAVLIHEPHSSLSRSFLAVVNLLS